jgi:hypothetical protein
MVAAAVPQAGQHTSASLRELSQTKRGVISRHRLKCDIAVSLSATLLLLALVMWRFYVQLAMLNRADGADFGIAATELALRIQDRVDM